MNIAISDSWVSLGVAIIFGVLGTISMKRSHGLRHLRPTLALVLSYCISFIALTFAMQRIELSVVYAVWSGVGTLLIALIGIFHFHESVSLTKFIFLFIIILGVIGIHLGDIATI